MKQRFEYDEVVAELGGSSFMTSRGIVVEGDYRIGEKVLLVFDKASKRYLPTYRRKKDKRSDVEEPVSTTLLNPTKGCSCDITISQDVEIFAGDPSYAIASVSFNGCTVPPDQQYVEWELIPGTCVPSGSVQPAVLETQLNALTWKADLTDADYCFVTVKAKFRGPGGIPKCEKSVSVKVIGCRCDASLTLDPGDRIGNLDILTANLSVNYQSCTQQAIDSVRVTWDVRVLSCEGTCDFEILEQDDTHIKIQPSISEGGWGVYEIQATIDGDDDVPFCEVFETFYVGCSCDVIVEAPAEVATSYVYEATIKGFYYDCNADEKQGAPLTFSFVDCRGNGPVCEVEIISQQQISQDPPEIKIEFAVHPLAGTGTVYLRGSMGNAESVPFCEQDRLIQFNCCLKEPGDRLVIIYTEPEGVETIGLGAEVLLWVDPTEDGGCPPFVWELDGPGEISVSEDTTACTYHGPETVNDFEGCEDYIIIKVTDACGTEDLIEMSINAWQGNEPAYQIWRCVNMGIGGSWCNQICGESGYNFHTIFGWRPYYDRYNCKGDFLGSYAASPHGPCLTHGPAISDCCDGMGRSSWPKDCFSSCETGCGPVNYGYTLPSCGQVDDLRTQAMKDGKCCPRELTP